MSRVTATDRVQRILAVLPWIVQHQGATVDEICERFGLRRDDLVADLDFVFVNVGLHPFTPDMLTDVSIEDDRVYVHLGDYFTRPLRLTHSEALTLLAAGRALGDRPGLDPDGTLLRAVAKLSAALGTTADGAVEVALGEADGEVFATVQAALASSLGVDLEYYSYARDETTRRRVDPYRVVAREGHWYLYGWCHTAGGERLFRIDRITSATVTDEHFDAPEGAGDGIVDLSDSPRTVELIAPASARWVTETYPCDEFEELDGERIRIVLPVTALPWLERLLLRLGPDVVATDLGTGDDLGELTAQAAARVARRYRSAGA